MADVVFPSVEWFQRLADLMNENRARQEQLGYVDCVAGFTVLDGGREGGAVTYEVTFEEFEATGVREAPPGEVKADFVLEGTLATWQEMIESISAGGGRPDLDHTLNRMSHTGDPLNLASEDPLKADLYFRYNQSLQEFVNASGGFQTTFARAA